MGKVQQTDVPEGSLLAEFGVDSDYRDCFVVKVPGAVTLAEFIERFYCSMAFRPERIVLGLIGRGANNEDAAKLARGEVEKFAAWDVVERSSTEILLRDFQGATASWLSVEPMSGSGTRLRFGSWVGKPDRLVVRAFMPFHRWYSRVLIGAVT